MFNAWDAHYRQINVLRFTQDAAALLAGSEDSGVSVWSIPRYAHVVILGNLSVTPLEGYSTKPCRMSSRRRIATSRITPCQ